MSPPPPAKNAPAVPWRRAARESLAHIRRALGLVWRSSPPLTTALGALTLAGAGLPLGVAYVGKRIVDAVVDGSSPETLRWVVVELALILAQAAVTRSLQLTRSILGSRLGIDINVAILERALTMQLADFENPEFYDRLTRARREASTRPISLLSESFALVQSLLTLIGYVAMLVKFSGWAVLALLLATIPATIAEMRYSKLAFRLRNWRSPESRRLMYLEYVLANDEHVKEVKLFGLGPLLLGRYKTLAEAFHDEDRRLAMKRAVTTQALSFLGSAAFYGAYALMALAAAAKRITLGTMTLYVLAFRQGQQSFQSVLSSIGSIYEHNLYMANLFEYLGAEAPARSSTPPAGAAASADKRGDAIVFEDVGFRYPDQDRWVLRHIDLSVPVGQSLALVGENGAGKTTLIKLLTRLYRPSEGRILLFGRDLNEWNEDELRAHFGVVFQDFNQYQLNVKENVGLGSVPHMEDEGRIERAVDAGGASEVISALPQKLETPLGRWFRDGTELSGGQWQKIALARAFMREEADVLVLDEPTAALDAEAEHAVFERFRALAKGRTTIVISHRFPTVRMADRILVLADGQISEQGTHAELVAAGKRYARLFALQAEGYR